MIIMRRKIGLILFGLSDSSVIAYKDAGMFLHALSKNSGWISKYIFFKTKEEDVVWPSSFLEYVEPICIGCAIDYKEQVHLANHYIKEHAGDFDVLMFLNYGNTIWKLAWLCKRYNPHILVYSKLDMGHGGFHHFENNSPILSIKNHLEKIKSRYVDWFTVETNKYYEILKNNVVFRNRIGYLPNGVSLLDVDTDDLDKKHKENILITVGRLGTYEKNNELLIDAITKIPPKKLGTWKFYFIGPYTDAFYTYVMDIKNKYFYLADKIILTGNISDRNKLYSFYKRAKIMCMTSRSESVCIAVVEAMYFAAYPIITYYSDFALDATDRCKCGEIVQSNPDDVANSLLKAIFDPCLEEKGKVAQSYAQSMFDYKVLSNNLNQQLEVVMNRK